MGSDAGIDKSTVTEEWIVCWNFGISERRADGKVETLAKLRFWNIGMLENWNVGKPGRRQRNPKIKR